MLVSLSLISTKSSSVMASSVVCVVVWAQSSWLEKRKVSEKTHFGEKEIFKRPGTISWSRWLSKYTPLSEREREAWTYLSKDTSCSSETPSSAWQRGTRHHLKFDHRKPANGMTYSAFHPLFYLYFQSLTERREPALALATDSFSFCAAWRCMAWKLLRAAENSFISRSFWIFCCLCGLSKEEMSHSKRIVTVSEWCKVKLPLDIDLGSVLHFPQ